MADILKINIAYVLPEKIISEFAALSKQISSQHLVYFILDQKHIPHFSLYQLYLPAKNLKKLKQLLQQICRTEQECTFHYMHPYYGRGYFGLDFKLSRQIKKLHELIIAQINDLRQGQVKEKYHAGNADYDRLSKIQQENIRKYGYPNARSEFRPHITLTRFRAEHEALGLAKHFNYSLADFTCRELGIFELSEHGTCKSLFTKFKLAN